MKMIEMEQQIYLNELVSRYPVLEACEGAIAKAYCLMRNAYARGWKLLVAGNGGSASDSEHIVGELMKSFKMKRPIEESLKEKLVAIDPEIGTHLGDTLESPLTAIALVGHEALSTAFLNDKDGLSVFAQQVLGFGKEGDVFLGISTSGNSRNVLYAAVVAKAMGLSIIGLTGGDGGKLNNVADVMIRVPETETFKVQELHLPVYHCLCLMLENYFFNH
jgi:D-sedoheptulose 7-phosphate isomerase